MAGSGVSDTVPWVVRDAVGLQVEGRTEYTRTVKSQLLESLEVLEGTG